MKVTPASRAVVLYVKTQWRLRILSQLPLIETRTLAGLDPPYPILLYFLGWWIDRHLVRNSEPYLGLLRFQTLSRYP